MSDRYPRTARAIRTAMLDYDSAERTRRDAEDLLARLYERGTDSPRDQARRRAELLAATATRDARRL